MMNQAVNRAFYQGIGAYVNCLNNLRIQDLQIAMKMIEDEARHVILNKDNSSKILNYARDNIEDVILKNRGGEYGGHGFIAEFAEAGIVNARRAFEGLNPIVKVLNDNGPADLLIGRNTIQMKFYNNLRDELAQSFHYSAKMKMMFPKDHVLVYEKIMAGAKEVEFNGKKLSIKQITDIRQIINDITESKGLTSYKSWMKSSVLNYDDAQRNSIKSILDSEEKNICKTVRLKQQELNRKRLVAQKNSLPRIKEANKIARNAAVLQGGLALMLNVYGKYKEGKSIFEFEQSDWLDCGLNSLQGVASGAISGYSLAGLFALYTGYKTKKFKKIITVSGSMWYPNFEEYIRKNKINSNINSIYFSLGNLEKLSENPILKTVEEKTKSIEKYLSNFIKTKYEENEENHFKNVAERISKGIKWSLEN